MSKKLKQKKANNISVDVWQEDSDFCISITKVFNPWKFLFVISIIGLVVGILAFGIFIMLNKKYNLADYLTHKYGLSHLMRGLAIWFSPLLVIGISVGLMLIFNKFCKHVSKTKLVRYFTISRDNWKEDLENYLYFNKIFYNRKLIEEKINKELDIYDFQRTSVDLEKTLVAQVNKDNAIQKYPSTW